MEESHMEESRLEWDFGCQRCWPADAEAAWEARGTLAHAVELIDESHWHVMILECPVCSQRFVSIFTETIDWEGGDDPQYWSLLPITEAEADDLVRQGDALTEAKLGVLGWHRRCLRVDHPKGAARGIFWATGVSVGPHD
jgi:hypothetical protein